VNRKLRTELEALGLLLSDSLEEVRMPVYKRMFCCIFSSMNEPVLQERGTGAYLSASVKTTGSDGTRKGMDCVLA